MSLSFGKDDVRKHLLDLGYTNISDQQLHDFMYDLKRLIRYDEKQKRIEAHLNYAEEHKKGTTPSTKKNNVAGRKLRRGVILINLLFYCQKVFRI